mmetsp:Transcript_25236/g.83985  ORF Transcript_25236/g.83985 Transcript_25236/m.83985 type:complete len:223 (-) Transcript_25236:887-1555(-)
MGWMCSCPTQRARDERPGGQFHAKWRVEVRWVRRGSGSHAGRERAGNQTSRGREPNLMRWPRRGRSAASPGHRAACTGPRRAASSPQSAQRARARLRAPPRASRQSGSPAPRPHPGRAQHRAPHGHTVRTARRAAAASNLAAIAWRGKQHGAPAWYETATSAHQTFQAARPPTSAAAARGRRRGGGRPVRWPRGSPSREGAACRRLPPRKCPQARRRRRPPR